MPAPWTDFITKITAADARAWDAAKSGLNSVKAGGAVGDGLIDDTGAVQSALNTGLAYFPPGTYLCGPLTVPHGCVMIGQNSGTFGNTFSDAQRSRLKLKNASNDHFIKIPTTSNRVLIRDLEIDGNKANQTTASTYGIFFQPDVAANETEAVIQRCYVHDCKGAGLRIDALRQAVRARGVISVSNDEYGIQILGGGATLTDPIVGLNLLDGIIIVGDVTEVRGGNVFQNTRQGITVSSGAQRIVLSGNECERNGRSGIFIDINTASVALVANMFTSNGQTTDNTYPHINVLTTTGNVQIVGNGFSDLLPGVTNQTTYAIQLGTNSTAFEAGNMYEGGSAGGYCNDTTRLYVSSRPSFREANTLWSSEATASVAAQGLDLPAALTEFDATFAGTRRTLTPAEGGRECQISVRARKLTSTAASTITIAVLDTSNTANSLVSTTIASTNVAGVNWETISAWTATPAWFTSAASKTLGVYTSGGNGADDWVLRDVTLKWRG